MNGMTSMNRATSNNQTQASSSTSSSTSSQASTTARRIRALVTACTLVLSPVAATAADLTISVSDIRQDSGKLMLNVLRNSQQMDNKETPEASMILSPSVTGVSFTLHNLQPGIYGLQIMHDENGNGELDANLLGIPKEPWAFSNNAAGKFGPPKWQDVQFTIGSDPVVQEITLNH